MIYLPNSVMHGSPNAQVALGLKRLRSVISCRTGQSAERRRSCRTWACPAYLVPECPRSWPWVSPPLQGGNNKKR